MDDWREDGQAAYQLELEQQEQEGCDEINSTTNRNHFNHVDRRFYDEFENATDQ